MCPLPQLSSPKSNARMDKYSKYYNELNPMQMEAVDATDGPLLVLAGPGTGKTQLLSVRAGAMAMCRCFHTSDVRMGCKKTVACGCMCCFCISRSYHS